MLKYIGDIDRLKDYGFEECNAYNEKVFGTITGYIKFAKPYSFEININPNGYICIEQEIKRSLDDYMREDIELQDFLYDLIKSGLVIKEDK